MTPEGGFMRKFTSGDDQQTALYFAFYNALLFTCTGICLAGVYAVYQMLHMFITPLLWATLVGTVLFPLKRSVTTLLNDWLKKLEETDTPVAVGFLLFPLQCVNKMSDVILSYFEWKKGMIVGVVFVILKMCGREVLLHIIGAAGDVFVLFDSFISFFSKPWIFPIIVPYFLAYTGWIFVQDQERINKKIARAVSVPIWIYGISLSSSCFGPLRVPIFLLIAVSLLLLATGLVGKEISEEKDDDKVNLKEVKESHGRSSENLAEMPNLKKAITSDFYIQVIFVLCVLLFTVRHNSVSAVAVVLVFLAFLKRMGEASGFFTMCGNLARSVWQQFSPQAHRFLEITVAGPLRQFFKLLFTSDKMLRSSISSAVDALSTTVVMVLLAFGSVFLVAFVGFQLYSETVHLIKLGSNIVSQQPSWLGFTFNYNGQQPGQLDFDDYVTQVYEQGRTWLAKNARNLVKPEDSERADLIEAQVKQVVDNLYHIWESKSCAKMNESHATVRGDWLAQLKNASNFRVLRQELMEMMQENIETVISVAQSVWSMILLNISLLSALFLSVIGTVVDFGLDIVHFLIEIIVFMTAVYYLLANSGNEWLPLKWINDALPQSSQAAVGSTSLNTGSISKAIETAISGVFVLSAKMAVFYGLYTYFIHALFDLNVVFIPSVLATLFAAIPIMGPYTVSIIGLVELFVVRKETAAAVCFGIASIAPMCFADAAFYSELRGSHPYVTGLAIIGGIYWLGLQGAIIGPVILCTMLILANVYADFVRS
ncbi:hypothetical protein AB6A40_003061 [Gnathostoma spinigerum]|uniref:Transmembrane protein 245 n=1 Tax=Gnathostoma spinigerum TaxID=75299 RepID=A0ABD6EI45_9BILA